MENVKLFLLFVLPQQRCPALPAFKRGLCAELVFPLLVFVSAALWLLLCTAQTCAGPERGHQCYLYWGWQQQHSKKSCARAGWVLKEEPSWQAAQQPSKNRKKWADMAAEPPDKPKDYHQKDGECEEEWWEKIGKPLAKAGMPGGERKKTSGKHGPRKKLA